MIFQKKKSTITKIYNINLLIYIWIIHVYHYKSTLKQYLNLYPTCLPLPLEKYIYSKSNPFKPIYI
jgi:hypothetical protein